MADESGSLIPRPSRETVAWRATGASLVGSAGFLFALGLLLYRSAPSWPATMGNAALFAGCGALFFIVHEAGHLAAARLHGVPTDPPWFLPIGAVMRLREVPPDRGALVEIGAAGPIAGLLALVLLLGVRHLAGPLPEGHLGVPLLWRLLAPGSPPLADPVAAAVALGCLVTALNLVPFGQLDGGHVVAGMFPARALQIGWLATFALLLAGFAWPGWAVWAAVIHLAGTRFPLTVRREASPPPVRAQVAAAGAVFAFALCLVPVPI